MLCCYCKSVDNTVSDYKVLFTLLIKVMFLFDTWDLAPIPVCTINGYNNMFIFLSNFN